MTQPIGWYAWYADGRRYSSAETIWADLPVNGCILAKAFFSDHNEIAHGTDAIIYDPAQSPCLIMVNLPTQEFQAVAENHARAGSLKFGQYLPDADYERIWRQGTSAAWEG